MKKTIHSLPFRVRGARAPSRMSAANFSRTPWGRAMLHAACLCRHPAAARFFLTGLTRNLRQWHPHCAH